MGEGANLGLTQLGRIETREWRPHQHRCHRQFRRRRHVGPRSQHQDRAGGPRARGEISQDQRDELLACHDGRRRGAWCCATITARRWRFRWPNARAWPRGFLARLMRSLERRGLLSRAVEFLPDDAAITERTRRGHSLTRPELAVLLAYAKLTLYDDLLVTAVPDDPYLARELSQYFPREVQDKFPDAVTAHRLRREIISTNLANAVINRGGPACVVRLIDETGADVPTIVMAFVAVDESYGLKRLNDAIDALDNKIDGQLQLGFYAAVQDLLHSRVVWYVRNVDFGARLEAVISRFSPCIREIAAGLDKTLPVDLQAGRSMRRQDLTDGGVPAELAGELADLDALVSAPDIVTVAERTNRAIGDTATTFFAAEANFRLDRIIAAARGVPANDFFERLAIDRAVDQIAGAERRLVADMLATGQSGQQAAENWLAAHPEATRIRRSVEEIAASGLTLAKLTVAANLLGDLVKG